jgi:2-haloacid dehalogenase
MIERYRLIAENCLFIDDNFNNIEAARKLNFQAIHFKSAEQLKLDLINLGILDL